MNGCCTHALCFTLTEDGTGARTLILPFPHLKDLFKDILTSRKWEGDSNMVHLNRHSVKLDLKPHYNSFNGNFLESFC